MPPRTLLSLLAALLVAPTALGWGGFAGSTEPNTMPDVVDGAMWLTPPPPFTERIYFDVVLVSTDLLLNTGSMGVDSRATILPVAMLGVWADCNGDGYVGHALLGGLDYPSEALLTTTVCPAGSAHWYAHGTNQWISELLAIGPNANCGGCGGAGFPTISGPGIDDADARVWGDFGFPDEATPGGLKASPNVAFSFEQRRSLADPVCDALCAMPGLWRAEPFQANTPGAATRLRFTGHADVGPATLATGAAPPPGGPFVYGVAQCGGGGLISPGGWVCDPAAWLGSVKVGDPYELRDVDCFGLGLGPTLGTSPPC